MSLVRQCALLGVSRSGYYAQAGRAAPRESLANLAVLRELDARYTAHPFFGSRRLTAVLRPAGYAVNRKRVQRLMRVLGIQGVRPGPATSAPAPGHRIYPYLLRDLAVVRPNQVWCSDITYVPLRHGFMYLTVVMDWYSRLVLSWALSNTLDHAFCLQALVAALALGQPDIFNTDQGSQYTCAEFTAALLARGIAVSMDGRGRALDNVFVERLWRSVKYEDIYLHGYETAPALAAGLAVYFPFYNTERPHQGLDYRTPAEVHAAV